MPFEVPESWVWCKLDDLAFYKKGPFGSSLTKAMFVPKGKDTYKVYEQKNAIQKDHKLGSYYISTEKYCSLSGFAVHPNDIIVSCAGTIGETYVLPQNIQEGIINQALMLIRLYNREIEGFYLLYFDFILKQEAYKESKGTAIKNIPPFDVLKNFFIPIPPKEEQKRILSEVDKWMSFVDDIDTNSKDLQLYIKHTKSKILDLAIHGKLVPQNPNDEPAIELLKRINPDFTPCDNGHRRKLPQGWVYCQLSNVLKITMGQSPKGDSLNNKRGIEFHQGKICFSDKFILESGIFTDEPTKIAEPNSILLCVRAPVGVVNITKNQICIGRGLCALTPFEGNADFYFYLLQTLQDSFNNQSTGTTFKAISGEIIKNENIILPPLAEQQRIVAKIEELFSVFDNIQKALEV